MPMYLSLLALVVNDLVGDCIVLRVSQLRAILLLLLTYMLSCVVCFAVVSNFRLSSYSLLYHEWWECRVQDMFYGQCQETNCDM